jgi:hypothetical protein
VPVEGVLDELAAAEGALEPLLSVFRFVLALLLLEHASPLPLEYLVAPLLAFSPPVVVELGVLVEGDGVLGLLELQSPVWVGDALFQGDEFRSQFEEDPFTGQEVLLEGLLHEQALAVGALGPRGLRAFLLRGHQA